MAGHARGPAPASTASTAEHWDQPLPWCGISSTQWEGGVFTLRITANEEYPRVPPKIRFLSEPKLPCLALPR